MSPRPSVSLSEELSRPRRKRRPIPKRPAVLERMEVEFWRSFNLEKFARDWQRGIGKAPRR